MDAAEWNRSVVLGWSEKVLQERVEELLRLHRWEWFHDQDSRRNRAGLPDLIAVRRGRLLFAELKAEQGRLRSAQRVWQAELEQVADATASDYREGPPAVQTFVWRPSDYLSGAIARVLA